MPKKNSKNIRLFRSSHSSKRMRLAARRLGMVDLDSHRPENATGLPGYPDEEADIM